MIHSLSLTINERIGDHIGYVQYIDVILKRTYEMEIHRLSLLRMAFKTHMFFFFFRNIQNTFIKGLFKIVMINKSRYVSLANTLFVTFSAWESDETASYCFICSCIMCLTRQIACRAFFALIGGKSIQLCPEAF